VAGNHSRQLPPPAETVYSKSDMLVLVPAIELLSQIRLPTDNTPLRYSFDMICCKIF
jgi:hypothetical protein